MPAITPCLWIQVPPAEAAAYYQSIFPTVSTADLGPMTGTMVIEGQRFMLLNGGPHHAFNDAVSFVVHCRDQADVDRYWDALTAHGGAESMCGWLKDKYGVSWQIVPDVLPRLLGHADRERAGRAMQAMLAMRKIVIADLERAFHG